MFNSSKMRVMNLVPTKNLVVDSKPKQFFKNKLFFLMVVLGLFFIGSLFVGPFGFLGAMLYGREGITAIASKLNIPSVCLFAPPSDTCDGWPCIRSYFCYNSVARENKNPKVCSLMQGAYDWNLRNECYVASGATSQQYIKGCTGFRKGDFNSEGDCFGYFAGMTQDDAFCRNASSVKATDQCYFRAAYIRKQPSVCENILNPPMASYCRGEVTKLGN